MSEYHYSNSKYSNKDKSQIEEILNEIRDVEFWQDENLKNILETKFSQESLSYELESLNKEINDIKADIEDKDKRIIQLSELNKLKELEYEEQSKILDITTTTENDLIAKIAQLKQEYELKQAMKANLANPKVVADLLFNSLDLQGLNAIFIQLYNIMAQHQQMYMNTVGYMMQQNSQMSSNPNSTTTNNPSNNSNMNQMNAYYQMMYNQAHFMGGYHPNMMGMEVPQQQYQSKGEKEEKN
jgi:chromosome segregation ATPase